MRGATGWRWAVCSAMHMLVASGCAREVAAPVERDSAETVDDTPALVVVDAVEAKDAWAAKLTPEQYHVTRQKGTERAFSSELAHLKADGEYRCVCCDAPLFESDTKYDSGTGWPSFWAPVDDERLRTVEDHSAFLGTRTEVLCRGCDAHLGHVFGDGPEPTGLRYCMNGHALKLQKTDDKDAK